MVNYFPGTLRQVSVATSQPLDERTVNAPRARRKAPLVAASCSSKDRDYCPNPLPEKQAERPLCVCSESVRLCSIGDTKKKKVITHVPD